MTTVHETPGRGQGLGGLLETLRRRRALAIVPFAFVLTAVVSLAFFLPSLWTSAATIMIDPQQIPETYVKPTVTGDVEARFLTLSQEILSDSRLAAIVDQYGLYPRQRRTRTAPEVVDRMRKDIHLEINPDRERRSRDSKVAIFSVSYTASNPVVAMQVANTLASLYSAENLRLREQQAASTSAFLQSQLEDARKKLTQQESTIAAYKQSHLGELPEQREMNAATLQRLMGELELANETVRRAEERKRLLTQSLAELEQATGGIETDSASLPASSDAARLSLLKQELAQALTKYSDKYPDVIYLKEQIRTLEAKVQRDGATAAASPKLDRSPRKQRDAVLRIVSQNPYIQSLVSQLDQANVELKTSSEQIASLQRQIPIFQRRLDVTPQREHELQQITRDYETTRELFRSLLAKRDEAGIAVNLEQRQKGEAFRILNPAPLPDRPAGPNRLRLLLIGFALAMGASGAAVLLAENVDTSFRRVEEVRSRLPVPVLSTIPRITTEGDRLRSRRQQRLATAGFALGLLVLVGSAYAVSHSRHQDELVRMFSPADLTAVKR